MSKIKKFNETFETIQKEIEDFSKTIPKKINKWNFNRYLSIERNITIQIRKLTILYEQVETSPEEKEKENRNIILSNINRQIKSLDTTMRLNSHYLLKFSLYFAISIALISLIVSIYSTVNITHLSSDEVKKIVMTELKSNNNELLKEIKDGYHKELNLFKNEMMSLFRNGEIFNNIDDKNK